MCRIPGSPNESPRAAVGAAVLLCAVVCVTACPGAQRRDELGLRAGPLAEGSFVTGRPVGLSPPEVVNRRDFIYALAWGADGTLAFIHHVTQQMELTVSDTAPLRPRFQQPVSPVEFDVEDVVIVPAGPARGAVVAPSRQGLVRAFSGSTGAGLREVSVGAPTVRASISPDGQVLAVGAADGRVFLLDAATFALRGQTRVHTDEIHGLAFVPDGRLVSASFDKTLVVSTLTPGGEPMVRLPAQKTSSGDRIFIAHLDDARAVRATWLPRQTSPVITTDAVKRLGLSPAADGARLPVFTAQGPADAPAVELGLLHIETLDLGSARAAVCDACVPVGADLALAGDLLARITLVEDVARDEVVVKPTEGPQGATLSPAAVTLKPTITIPLPGPATDVDVNRRGEVAVAFSHARAVRSFELYEAEKRGDIPAVSAASGAALVDLATQKLARTFHAHRGFTTTVALSPDGRTLVTGGWDKRAVVFDTSSSEPVATRELGWLVRRARFAPDGRTLGVAAWTPVSALNSGDSDPSMLLYPLELDDARVVP